jgi:hypothetical protein
MLVRGAADFLSSETRLAACSPAPQEQHPPPLRQANAALAMISDMAKTDPLPHDDCVEELPLWMIFW